MSQNTPRKQTNRLLTIKKKINVIRNYMVTRVYHYILQMVTHFKIITNKTLGLRFRETDVKVSVYRYIKLQKTDNLHAKTKGFSVKLD